MQDEARQAKQDKSSQAKTRNGRGRSREYKQDKTEQA